jgi:hypothetical protein
MSKFEEVKLAITLLFKLWWIYGIALVAIVLVAIAWSKNNK